MINPLEEDLESFVRGLIPMGADYGIDVVGSQMMEAVKAVRKGGTVLLSV